MSEASPKLLKSEGRYVSISKVATWFESNKSFDHKKWLSGGAVRGRFPLGPSWVFGKHSVFGDTIWFRV